jgi:hypothetical protein
MKEESKRKLKSTTFWLSIVSIALNPIAWWYDHYRTMRLLEYINEHGMDEGQLSFVFNSLPLTTIATASLAIVTSYVAGNKGRNIAENVKKKTQA